ncbi:hypothetical protein [Anaerosporobacter faecicola]|uniref:hypothetical protein n=1 Tax=Anaerosporobacter faecicola TaxID=2718714 RepID=UPI00143B2A82|nr:hypothetical protein [Anaerosporobacter faecicola]
MLFSKKATKVLDEQTELFENREKDREKKGLVDDEQEKLQWRDLVAMWIAGFITFVPAILLVCALFGLVIWLFFFRFM